MIYLAMEVAAFLFLLIAAGMCVGVFLGFGSLIWDAFRHMADDSQASRALRAKRAADEAAEKAREDRLRAEVARHTLPTHKGKPMSEWLR